MEVDMHTSPAQQSPASSPGSSLSGNDSADERAGATAAQQGGTGGSIRSRATSAGAVALVSNYSASMEQRRAMFEGPPTNPTPDSTYDIQSIFSIPTSTHIQSLAAPPCLSHIYSGGADGYIRRYALHATLNATGMDNPLFPNLSMKAPSRQPVLVGYWENEDQGDWMNELLGANPSLSKEEQQTKVSWGPKVGPVSSQSPVYSLAVQSEELWGLSGTGHGSINLFTIRLDEGHIRHVFRPSSTLTGGHHPKAPVSVLTLTDKETSFLSGGWDGRIFQWDLNTGAATRDYSAHAGQISSIAFRPAEATSTTAVGEDVDMVEGDASRRVKTDQAAGADTPASESSSRGVAASLVKAAGDATGADDGGSEADADGEEVDDEALDGAAAPSADNVKPAAMGSALISKATSLRHVPMVGGAEDLPQLSRDIFLSTSVHDGQVMIWDRRIKSGAKGGVRRLNSSAKHGSWALSAAWSTDGQQIFVGRRTSVVEVFDIRHSSPTAPTVRTLHLPSSTGAISSVVALPSGRHLLTASNDNVRLWDLDRAAEPATKVPPFTVIPGHHGGMISQIYIDSRTRWMITASGNRGWEGASTENLIIHQIKARALRG